MKKHILRTTIFVLLSSTALFAGADAGIEQEVRSGDKVQLSGAGSTLERDGRFVRFNWRQTEGNPYVSLSNTRTLQTAFTAPSVTESTVLTFRLTTKERFRNRRDRKRIFRSRDFVDVIVLPQDEIITSNPDVNTENNPEVIQFKDFNYLPVTSPETGRVWLDRNLGAKKLCINATDVACFGDLYQWGREADGHELKSSPVSFFRNSTLEIGSNLFFADAGSGDYSTIDDWTGADKDGSQRSANWSKTDGTSICPVGYRVPSSQELLDESIAINKGFNGFLKIPNAGERAFFGDYVGERKRFLLWSSTPSVSEFSLSIKNNFNEGLIKPRNEGHSVRCVKD